MKLIGVKSVLVIYPKEDRDSVLEEEKDSKSTTQHFLDYRVSLK